MRLVCSEYAFHLVETTPSGICQFVLYAENRRELDALADIAGVWLTYPKVDERRL